MTTNIDPFQHLPHLRHMVSEPSQSRYRSMDMSVMDQAMRDAGYPDHWRRTDDERERTRLDALRGRSDRDLWVFAYGSLMWDPAFHFSEVRTANLTGYHRRFCLRTRLGRGSFANPGLMAALDCGGGCNGLSFRIHRDDIETETKILWSREMMMLAYDPIVLEVETPQGPLEALAFVINHSSENYIAELPLEKAAEMIASAHGLFGSNLDYLDNLAEHLIQLNIEDRDFSLLHEAARRMAGHTAPDSRG